MQISRLLSSVPQGMDPAAYFSGIAPQLLALIDGDDPDLRKTAAYTVGSGILGKRAYGAPGTIGHSIFVEPIFKTLTAGLDESARRWMGPHAVRSDDAPGRILVGEPMMNLAIDRLRALALQHPNPGLVKRLVYPVLFPLWGLACYSLEQQNKDQHERVITLLQAYFGVSVGMQPLKKLVDNLLWDGGPTWEYCLGDRGGISLKERDTASTNQFNFVRLMDSLQSRVELFVSLLGSDPNSEERTGDIFLYVSETWLVKPSDAQRSLDGLKLPEEDGGPGEVIQRLISAKIAEKLMDSSKDTLSRRPLKVLELINQVIGGELEQSNAQRRSTGVSLSSLANVVPREDDEQAEVSAEDSAESLSAVFSLLSTVIVSPEFHASGELAPVLEDIRSRLGHLIPSLPSSLAKPATTATMLLEIHLASPDQPSTEKSFSHIPDLDTHRQALTNLNSDLPPVQAEGFSLLSDLIKKSSPVLDIPSTLTLLLSIITDTSEAAANEEFIYLNAIKLIGTLASRHPRTVIKTLVERYTDRSEEITLDQRLRIGESLLRTVQDLGYALTGETGRILGEGMVAVAGRRGHKPEAQKRRKQLLEKERREEERQNRRELDIPAEPQAGDLINELTADDEDSETESPEQTAHAANIIAAWAAGAPSDTGEPDDLRARASAVSILASAVQTNIAGLGPSIVSSAVDLSLSTLVLEPSPESAILRRASAILLLDILKSVDAARETRRHAALGFGFSLSDEATRGGWSGGAAERGTATIGNIPHMLRTLQVVESRETDGIVRGHIRVLVESLEAWMEKSLLYGIGARGDGEGDEPRLELGERIAGLSVDPMAGADRGQRPRIEEIE
ncbi:hypothetical protein PHISP_06760 [Aspergillus sp. HF37]|nr:hypothetical protein PHISP_06760 [Aspergillus sp. HF37]